MKTPLLILALFFSLVANAAIRFVPAQYSTIQAALNSCNAGDTVIVSPGVYYENIVWPGNTAAIKLLSAGDQTNTTIDGNHSGTVLTISANYAIIDSTTSINGFRIRNGYLQLDGVNGYGTGAGIYVTQATPKITNCTIKSNSIKKGSTGSSTSGFGAGMFLSSTLAGNLILRNVEFLHNTIDSADNSSSSALFLSIADIALIENCTFKQNKITGPNISDGLMYFLGTTAIFNNTVIKKNEVFKYGPSIYGLNLIRVISPTHFTNCLISQNTIEAESAISAIIDAINVLTVSNTTISNNTLVGNFTIGIIWIAGGDTMHLNILNSILWNPSDPYYYFGEVFAANYDGSTISVTYSDILYGGYYDSAGNISLDPQFKAANNFHLQTSSPCINAGTNVGAPSYDLDGKSRPLPANTNVDMGCFERNQDARLEVVDASIPGNILLYPNPASSGSLLQFNLKNDCLVNVSLNSVDGKEIKTFANKEMEAGDHELELDLRSISPGLYFVVLKMGSQSVTRTLVIQ